MQTKGEPLIGRDKFSEQKRVGERWLNNTGVSIYRCMYKCMYILCLTHKQRGEFTYKSILIKFEFLN